MTYGATKEQWQHFASALKLASDLLPVVSNPNATISPDSKMKALGKTPSQYNGQRHVAGIADWTSKQATPVEVNRWSKEGDYGICLQTRTVRALDIDVADTATATAIRNFIEAFTGKLPARVRSNSGKLLLACAIQGQHPKRILKVNGGIVEFLGNGQQFVAIGTHPSGVRYEWEGGLPEAFPELGIAEFDEMWGALADEFGIEESKTASTVDKAAVLADAVSADATSRYLIDNGWALSTEKDGRLHITCPWEDEHTTESAESATTYWPAHTGGFEQGHFKCLHAHCEHRTDEDFRTAIGMSQGVLAEFEDLGTAPVAEGEEKPAHRFQVVPAHDFSEGKAPPYLIHGVLPEADLAVVYGDSGSGKTFSTLDMIVHLALGLPWRGLKTRAVPTVYICAEGAGGFRKRLKAQMQQHGLRELPEIGVIGDAPNFMEVKDVKDIILSANAYHSGPGLVVVDTAAQVLPGANENSGEDMGKVLAHCRQIRKHTGKMVLLVMHTGKDASRGARGWSGMRAAADVELEVSREGNDRLLSVTKLKDGDDGRAFPFKLNTVAVGWGEDGEEISSCVVEHLAVEQMAQHPSGGEDFSVLQIVLDNEDSSDLV